MMLHFIIKTKYFNKSAKDLVAIQKEFSNLYSTQSKAVALKAISTYLGQPKNAKIDVDILVNGELKNYQKPTLINLDKLHSETIELDPKGKAMSYTVELVENLKKPLKNQLSTTKELNIKREFIDEDGKDVDLKNLEQGDKIFSKVTLVNYGKINHVVVNQRTPACFEIVNNNIKNRKARYKNVNANIEHQEIRDDRILHFLNLPKKEEWNSNLHKYVIQANRAVLYSPLIASTTGECMMPAVITEAMYDARMNDYAKEVERVVVKNSDHKTTQMKKPPHPQTVTPKEENKKQEPKKEAKKVKTLSQRAEALVKEIYSREMNSNNPLEFAEFFSFPLDIYFRTKDFTKDELLKDKRKYFKDWSKRIYTNMKTTVEQNDKKTKEVKVKISFKYAIYNGKKVLKGRSNHLLTVVEKNGKLRVKAVELWKKKK